jgi:hypothetical protein
VITYGAFGRNKNQRMKPMMKKGFIKLSLFVYKTKIELIKKGMEAKNTFHNI